MAISKVGFDIEITSGLASGTASGGTVNTLTGSGFSSDWVSRIIYLTSGTGDGQSRCVKSVTNSNSIEVYEDWETQPDSTTNFTISYDVSDMVSLADCDYIGLDAGKIVEFKDGNVVVKSGGVFGGVKNTLILPTDKTQLTSKSGGFIQFGMSIDGQGREGGTLIQSNHANGYVEQELSGTTRFYGMDFVNKMQGTPVGANKLTRINQVTAPQKFTAYDCDFRDVVLLEDFNTDTKNCNFVGERSGLMTFSPPINSFGHKIFSGLLSPRAERNLNGADLFDVQYFGDAPNDPFFNKPVFLFNFNTETYYWNLKFPDGFANAFRWYNNNGLGTVYEGYSVKPIIQDSSGSPIPDARIALIDKDGNAGWTTGKDANFEPVKTDGITSDSNGTITNSIGNNENGLVISGDWTKVSETVTSAVIYYPFTLYVKKYGIVPIKKTNLNYTSRSVELIGASDNVRLVSNKTEASQITGINLSFNSKSITISQNTTAQKLFDFFHFSLSLNRNKTKDDDIFVLDFVNISDWSLTLDGCTYTGAITTTTTITLLNGAKATGILTDSSGIRLPDRNVSISSIVAGSRLQIFNVTTGLEVKNEIVAGTTYTAAYEEGNGYSASDVIRVRLSNAITTTAYLGYSTTAIVTATGWSVLANQELDTVYNSIGIDGSTVTKFSADYTNVDIDLAISTNFSIQEFYAWWVYDQTTAQSIRQFFSGVTALNIANIRINVDILNLYLDSTVSQSVRQTDNVRIFRSDLAYPVRQPTTSGYGLDVNWRNELFVVELEKQVSALTSAQSTQLGNIVDVLADTNELQANQGNFATATGFSTFESTTDEVITDTSSRDASKGLTATESTKLSNIDTVTKLIPATL